MTLFRFAVMVTVTTLLLVGGVGLADGALRTFTLKDGSKVSGTVLDEGETQFLVRTADGTNVRVLYSEIVDVSVDGKAVGTEVEPSGLSVFGMREELGQLLNDRAALKPVKVTVLEHGVRYRWDNHEGLHAFCPGSVRFIDSHCAEGWMGMVSKTTHWSELAHLKTIRGEHAWAVGTDCFCVAVSERKCLAVTRTEADAARVEELVRGLADARSD